MSEGSGSGVEVPRVRVSGHSVAGEVYPDLVDGRVENDSAGAISRQAVIASSRASRRSRSYSLLPENAAMVRKARMNMSQKRKGFTSVVLGEVQSDTHDLAAAFGHDSPKPVQPLKHPALAQRRASSHKLLSVTKSDPLMAQGKQCVSCIGHPDYCLSALGLHDACPAHSSLLKTANTPRRSHSLRAHAYRMTSSMKAHRASSFKVLKSDRISEETESSSATDTDKGRRKLGPGQMRSASASPSTIARTPRPEIQETTVEVTVEPEPPTRTKAKKETVNEDKKRKESKGNEEQEKPADKKEEQENLDKIADSVRRVSI